MARSLALATAIAALAARLGSAGELDAWAPLEADDECGTNADAGCALHALQLRGKKVEKRSEGEGEPLALEAGTASRSEAAPLFTFYMYRAQGPNEYAFENVNAANMPGVLWYLQHEVMIRNPPKFGITRVRRMLVQTRAPQGLAKLGMNFGPRHAIDSGRCGTAPFDCMQEFSKYGFFVGCNNLGEWPYPTFKTAYDGGIWYALPGKCPSKTFEEASKDRSCQVLEPGGSCSGTPTGADNCTYNYTFAGELSLQELQGPLGHGFWANPDDPRACAERVRALAEKFTRKYPNLPADLKLQAPRCDFDRSRFYR